jgi:spermidine synthase
VAITRLAGGLVLRRTAGGAGRERVEILAGNVVLLSDAALRTELLFGRLVAELAAPRRVLIGGLGFGATLRGALDSVGPHGPVGHVVVAEKVEAVAELVRGGIAPAPGLAHLAGRPLDDPRARLVIGDVLDVAEREGPWDAILLDVDNGPHWASFRTNARLYAPAGLAALRRTLTAGGSLAVWSGYPADDFLARLRSAGFAPRCIPLREREGGPVRARAYVGTRAA